jgi:uncharacterized protein YneF (UPF0154 family)
MKEIVKKFDELLMRNNEDDLLTMRIDKVSKELFQMIVGSRRVSETIRGFIYKVIKDWVKDNIKDNPEITEELLEAIMSGFTEKKEILKILKNKELKKKQQIVKKIVFNLLKDDLEDIKPINKIKKVGVQDG